MSADKLRFTKEEQRRFTDRILGLRVRAIRLYASPDIDHAYAQRILRLFSEWQRRWSDRPPSRVEPAE